MKICLIAPVPPFRGGIAKYCLCLAKELEVRHDLLLLSYRRQYPEFLYGRKSQLDPEGSRVPVAAEFRRLAYDIDSADPRSWRDTVTTVAAFGPDLVLLPWWVAYWAPMYLYLLHAFGKRGVRVVFVCINVFEHEDSWLKRFLTRTVLRRVDRFIVHSDRELHELLSLKPDAIVRKQLLPLFDYPQAPREPHDGALHLLFFGFVRPYKGLDTLLEAVALLRGENVSLRIVGEFWHDKERYLTQIKELGISDRIEIVDRYVPDREMGRHFSWADLVVLPYRRSITSGVVATAYGYGKPVLVTDVGGFWEVVEDGYTGRIVKPGNPRAFADGIGWFLANREMDFAAQIDDFASRQLSWASLVDRIEELHTP